MACSRRINSALSAGRSDLCSVLPGGATTRRRTRQAEEKRLAKTRIRTWKRLTGKKPTSCRLFAVINYGVLKDMKTPLKRCLVAAICGFASLTAWAQLNKDKGNGPHGVPELTFFEHRLG